MESSQQPEHRPHGHLFAALQPVIDQFPDHPAFVGGGGKGSRYTYGEMQTAVYQLAAALRQPPYADLPVIGILAENRPEWCLAYLAIVTAGKTVVPVDANLKQNEISGIVSHAGLRAAFVSKRLAPVAEGLSDPVTWIGFDTRLDDSFEAMRERHRVSYPTEPIEDNPLAVLIYTSGTTGAPKAVMLTHDNILANIRQAKNSLHFNHEDRFLSVLPLHHTFEATCGFLAAIFSGASVIYARSLKSKDILEDIKQNGITLMCGVPLLYEKMHHSIRRALQNAPASRRALFQTLYTASSLAWKLGRPIGSTVFKSLRQKAGLSSVRMFVSGGAAIPAEIAEFFNLIGFLFLQGYGMTECSPVISANRPDDIKFGSVGPPLDDIDVRIHEPNADGIGEVIVRGPNVSPGYRDNPEATAQLIRNGWLHTGDLGRMADGHLWITGRAKNVIISAAGKNIYPEEIEEMLLTHDIILETVVFGRGKEGRQGEEVRAVVVPNLETCTALGIEIDPPDVTVIKARVAAVIEAVNKEIAAYKRISGFELSLEELEKTSTKKVKRFLYH